MPTPADVAILRSMQDDIRVLVVRDLEALFASLNLSRPEAVRDALLEFVPVLVQTYGEQSASMAADWYDDVRAAERVPGRFRASMRPSPYLDATEGTVRRAAGALFTDNPVGALTSLAAVTPKYALAAGRETITRSSDRDPQAAGWKRVTRSGACEFCRLLAGREGAVYSKASVHFASHNDCNCAAVPEWDPNAPEVDVDVYKASERTTRMTPEQREAHNARIRQAIDEYVN